MGDPRRGCSGNPYGSRQRDHLCVPSIHPTTLKWPCVREAAGHAESRELGGRPSRPTSAQGGCKQGTNLIKTKPDRRAGRGLAVAGTDSGFMQPWQPALWVRLLSLVQPRLGRDLRRVQTRGTTYASGTDMWHYVCNHHGFAVTLPRICSHSCRAKGTAEHKTRVCTHLGSLAAYKHVSRACSMDTETASGVSLRTNTCHG